VIFSNKSSRCRVHKSASAVQAPSRYDTGFRCNLLNAFLLMPFYECLAIHDRCSNGWTNMTFIIEATKDDHRTADIRSSAIDAVILARKLAAEGFAVSIQNPAGRQYSADQFKLLLTNESLN
jgi:hypothetical protein